VIKSLYAVRKAMFHRAKLVHGELPKKCSLLEAPLGDALDHRFAREVMRRIDKVPRENR